MNSLGQLQMEQQIQLSDFLEFCTQRYWNVSYLFSSWEDRMALELALEQPNQPTSMSWILDFLQSGKPQRAIQSAKGYFFSSQKRNEYFSVLEADLILKSARFGNQKQEISEIEYRRKKQIAMEKLGRIIQP